MSELGTGKDSPAGKSPSLKTPFSAKDVPLKGKDNDSAKSKKGKKVQFNGDDWSKGGKGGKGVGGKTPVAKDPPKYDLNVEHELPKNAECLMDCEAAEVLQGVQEQMIILSRDPTIKLPPSFDQGLQYAKSTARYTNTEAVRQVLQSLKKQGVFDGEICVIANTGPETIEEMFALLPTLKAKGSKVSDALKEALGKLEELRCPTEGFKD